MDSINSLPLYWLRGSNFGDALNPVLYQDLTGRPPEYGDQGPKLIMLGSTLAAARKGDVIWGAGCITENSIPEADRSIRVLALRGHLSAFALAAKGFIFDTGLVLGSPAWLLPIYHPFPLTGEHEIGFLPHYAERHLIQELPGNVLSLHTATPPLELVRQITTCKMIVSSSLHGIIVAEAYGIPAVWVELSDRVYGSGFKFKDYYSATFRRVTPMDWRKDWRWEEAQAKAKDHDPAVIGPNERRRLLASCPLEVVHDSLPTKVMGGVA